MPFKFFALCAFNFKLTSIHHNALIDLNFELLIEEHVSFLTIFHTIHVVCKFSCC